MLRRLFVGEEKKALLKDGLPVDDIALASQASWCPRNFHCIPLLLVPSPASNENQMASRVLDGATGLTERLVASLRHGVDSLSKRAKGWIPEA